MEYWSSVRAWERLSAWTLHALTLPRSDALTQPHQLHPLRGFSVRFLDPFHDSRRVGRVFQFN